MRANRRTGHHFTSMIIALGLALGLGAVAPAHAGQTTKRDPKSDYILGSPPGIDLAKVQLASLRRKRSVRITFRLHEPVASEVLRMPGGLAAEFVKDKRTMRAVRVYTVDGALRGDVCSYDTRKEIPLPEKCAPVRVAQVDARSYRAVVKVKRLKKRARVLRWSAGAMDIDAGVLDVLRPKKGRTFRWRL